ncbi:helix-turn-helix domain-containing protein [Paenibacillus validus]|uniref:helix-turn-helix domain-containing protein n=1 Tax=Paenibacillus validus TaxID=44253 RepID=UPI003D2DDEB8
MADLLSIIGARIRALRKERGWSQEKLAELADLNASYVGKIERGEKNTTFRSLEKVSGALDISMLELFRYMEPVENVSDKDTFAKIINMLQSSSDEERKKVLQLLQLITNWNK